MDKVDGVEGQIQLSLVKPSFLDCESWHDLEGWPRGMASLSDGSGILHLPRLCKIACGAEGGGKQQLDCSAATSGISLESVKRALHMGQSSQHRHSLLATGRELQALHCRPLSLYLLLCLPSFSSVPRWHQGSSASFPRTSDLEKKLSEAYPVLHCRFIRRLSNKWSSGMVLEAMQ